MWPTSSAALIEEQRELAAADPPPWRPPSGEQAREELMVGGCFVCFPREHAGTGAAGDRAWAGAALMAGRRLVAARAVAGTASAPYEPGLLAMREGPLLEAAVRALPHPPDLLLVNATGRDHPRRAGLATQLGAVLDLPTIGVTHRPLVAAGSWPGPWDGAASPLLLDGQVVGYWLRTQATKRPLAVHAGWRVDAQAALDVLTASRYSWRTPEPLRQARKTARTARARDVESSRLPT
jgi:deoxyribonuclease V